MVHFLEFHSVKLVQHSVLEGVMSACHLFRGHGVSLGLEVRLVNHIFDERKHEANHGARDSIGRELLVGVAKHVVCEEEVLVDALHLRSEGGVGNSEVVQVGLVFDIPTVQSLVDHGHQSL